MTMTQVNQPSDSYCDAPFVHREQFTNAMRMVANTVAVVTTHTAHGFHGATVSAFCSVSADPPTVLVCLNDSSRIARQVTLSGQFCLNILDQEMSAIADRFAGRHDGEVADRFDGIDHRAADGCCPALAGALSLHCTTHNIHTSGSHRTVFGRVTGIVGDIHRPLTYLDGAYRPWLV